MKSDAYFAGNAVFAAFFATFLALPACSFAQNPPPPAALPTAADAPVLIDEAGGWRVLSAGRGANKICYVANQPDAAQPGERRDPRPMLFVAWRPGNAAQNVVTFFPAYRFKPAGEALVEFVPPRTGRLFTTPDAAWAATPEDDGALVLGMRIAHTITIRGLAEDGRAIADTFSLAGFTAASARAMLECGVR